MRKLELRLRPLQSHLKGPNPDSQFVATYGTWVQTRAEPELAKLSQKCAKMQEEYKNVLAWFGEPNTVKADEFFAMFYDFSVELEVQDMVRQH